MKYRLSHILFACLLAYSPMQAQSPFTSNKQSVLLSNAQSGASERWISFFAPASLSTNYRLIFPTTAPSVGQLLNVASISGSDYTMQWASGVTGSGTATRIAFWNGSSSLSSSSNLFWDNTNSRLGIGTATPSARLEVSGTTIISDTVTLNGYSGTAGGRSLFMNGGDLHVNGGTDGMFGILQTNSGTQKVGFYGSDLVPDMIIDNVQNTVGIGTGSNSGIERLEVKDGNLVLTNTGTARELRFYEPSASGSNYTAFKAQAQSSNLTYTLPATDGASGAYLSTNGSGTLSWASMGSTVFVRKPSDESMTSNTTIQDDDHLFFSIAANEVWEVDFMLRVYGDAGDIKFALTLPAGASMWVTARGDEDLSSDDYREMTSSGTAYNFNVGGNWFLSPTGTLIQLRGLVINSSTAGTVQLRWAQFSSNATATTVKQHSYLKAARLQ